MSPRQKSLLLAAILSAVALATIGVGVVAFLTKPVDREGLLVLLSEYLNKPHDA